MTINDLLYSYYIEKLGEKNMIRVLQVVTQMNRGGLETMIMNYYRNINRENVQFDFLEHRKDEADYDKEILELGGRIYRISRLNPFSISYKKELRDFFEVHPEYQIIHVHQDCMSAIILEVAKEKNVQVRIAHSHSSSQDKNIKYPLKLFFRKFIARYATDLMACGNKAGQWMFAGAKFQVLNNAIDTSKYVYDKQKRKSVRKEFGVSQTELLVGHVGRFSYPKNHEFLIKIFKAINDKISAKLLLVGNGELMPEIQNEVYKLGLSDKVIFAGLRTDVARLLQGMDVFVFPSIYEGLPVSVVEAQAAGVPCIISDTIPEECILINELVKRVSLSMPPEKWGDGIIELSKIERKDYSSKVKDEGYDIVESAKWLENFYLNQFTQMQSN
jgi:glycosyltransferase involved in cell wall biosynthesis